jgi:hypothetical protein
VEFLNTISWGGIADISVGGVSILSQAAVLSASGVDWKAPFSHAVPIPPVWMLCWTGLAALLVARRARATDGLRSSREATRSSPRDPTVSR